MVVRESNAIFLEVLEGDAIAPGVPIEFDVYDGAEPATMLATLENAFDKSFQVVLDGLGAGQFRLPRGDAKNTPSIIRKGNLVKCRVGGVYRHAFWMDDILDTPMGPGEGGDMVVQVAGAGVGSYLERAIVYPPVWPPRTIARVGSAVGTNTGGSNVTVATTGTKDGDTEFVAVAVAGGSSANVTPPAGKGWAEVGHDSAGTSLAMFVFRRQRTGSNGASTATFILDTNRQATAMFVGYRGVNPDATAMGAASQNNGSSVNVTAPALDAGLVNSVSVFFGATATSTSMAPPAGYTEVHDNSTSGIAVELAEKALGTTLGDTGPLVGTAGAAAVNVAWHLMIAPTNDTGASYTGATWGAILADQLAEAQGRGAIPDLLWTFDSALDSQGEAWVDSPVINFPAGTSLLDVWAQAMAMGLDSHVTHDLVLHVYEQYQRDKTADVIFRQAVHIRGELGKRLRETGLKSNLLVQGAGGLFFEVTDPAIAADPHTGRREGYLAFTNSPDPTTVQRAGENMLDSLEIDAEAISVPVLHAPNVAGQFEPWQHYRPGDLVALDVPGTYDLAQFRVVGLTLADADGGGDYDLVLDLNAIDLEHLAALKLAMDQLTGREAGSGSRGGSLSSSGSGANGNSTTGLVSVVAGSPAGYLYDVVAVAGGIEKAVSGNRLLLTGAGGTLDALDDVDLATDPPEDGQALIYNDALDMWVPGTVAAGGGGDGVPSAADRVYASQNFA